MKFGNQLYELRKRKGLNQKEASQRLGVSPGYLSRVENNKEKPSLELIQKASLFYGLNPSYFLESERADVAEVLPGKTLDGITLTHQEIRGMIAFVRSLRSIDLVSMKG